MSDSSLCMFPGTFDPPTNGHVDIIRRCSRLYRKVYVVVGDNMRKECLFNLQERMDLLRNTLTELPNVIVDSWNGLVGIYARQKGIGVMIRGVRAMDDFGFEFERTMYNRLVNSDLEVLFMPTSPENTIIRSSSIKEMARFGADVSMLVPPLVDRALKGKRLVD